MELTNTFEVIGQINFVSDLTTGKSDRPYKILNIQIGKQRTRFYIWNKKQQDMLNKEMIGQYIRLTGFIRFSYPNIQTMELVEI